MIMTFPNTILPPLLALSTALLPAMASDVPTILPMPDVTPPATDRPVKVYILSGQSNMVGFGKLKDAQPVYPSIYFSADPCIVPCRMPVGPSAILPHGIYQSAATDAATGASVAVYQGRHSPNTDFRAMTPTKQTTIQLGTVAAQLPTLDGEHTTVATAWIDVPMSGTYEVHAGHGDSSYAVVTLNNQLVYHREIDKQAVLTRVQLIQGQRYPLTITYLKGGSAAFWLKMPDIQGKGDLTSLIKEGKFPWFGDGPDRWTQRNDVIYREVRITKEELGEGGPLSPTSNAKGKFIGPEIPFGYVMGTYHDEPVLLIESSMGNRSLSFDFRPPSSDRNEPNNDYEGYEYRHMVHAVRKTLENIESIMPNYQGQGYEIAGFAWWQGHKDRGVSKEEYEQHLVNLIQDLRKDLNAPEMPAVVATIAFHGKEMIPEYREIHQAQMAVGDPKHHPEFAEKVKSIDTTGFWRPQGLSPKNIDFHYNFNAETYILTGDAMGRAMVGLLGGTVEPLALPPSLPMHPNVTRIYSDAIVRTYDNRDRAKYDTRSENPTPEEYAAMAPALRPIILDEIIPEFIDTAFSDNSWDLRGGIELKKLLTGKRPDRQPDTVQSQLDLLAEYYTTIGIDDYQWQRFGPLDKNSDWFYFSFDPPEKQAAKQSNRYREITFPEGMANWNAPDFDPSAAAWKIGQAPFGQKDGKLEARRNECYQPLCGCDQTPNTLWEKEVLLMQQTFNMPPAKEGHAYRLMLGGAGCDRSGEGYAVYINGKLAAMSKGGYNASEGIRGTYLYDDILPEFDGGPVTISAINFLRYTFHRNRSVMNDQPVPPNGQVSLWLEEAKIPEAAWQRATP